MNLRNGSLKIRKHSETVHIVTSSHVGELVVGVRIKYGIKRWPFSFVIINGSSGWVVMNTIVWPAAMIFQVIFPFFVHYGLTIFLQERAKMVIASNSVDVFDVFIPSGGRLKITQMSSLILHLWRTISKKIIHPDVVILYWLV